MSELTDKMRTCAAYIRARPNDAPLPTEHLLDDAAKLLEEAAKLLDDACGILGEPAPSVVDSYEAALARHPVPQWVSGGDLPPNPHPRAGRNRHPRVCPQCDSHANKWVRQRPNGVYLGCPVCAAEWKYQP